MRYHRYSITFNEVPSEISLVISITGCGGTCKGCHSPFLHNPSNGHYFSLDFYRELLDKYEGQITTVCFLGGEWYLDQLNTMLKEAKKRNIKRALYTSLDYKDVPRKLKHNLNYLKVGPYTPGLGGLESVITNQRLYQLKPKKMDITHKFWPLAKPKINKKRK
jgi:anaerobic ribonucleoside-triphosphate reductase activating protein